MNPLVDMHPMVAVNRYEPLGGCAPYGGYELDVTDTQDSDGRKPNEIGYESSGGCAPYIGCEQV